MTGGNEQYFESEWITIRQKSIYGWLQEGKMDSVQGSIVQLLILSLCYTAWVNMLKYLICQQTKCPLYVYSAHSQFQMPLPTILVALEGYAKGLKQPVHLLFLQLTASIWQCKRLLQRHHTTKFLKPTYTKLRGFIRGNSMQRGSSPYGKRQ